MIEALDDFDMVARYVTFTLLVILGLLFACGGRRYEPPFLSTMGFCVMAVVVYTVLGQATVWQTWTNYLCAILAGLIFTFFVDKIKVLGFFCAGVALACVVASIALSDASVYTFAARNAIPIAIGLTLVAILYALLVKRGFDCARVRKACADGVPKPERNGEQKGGCG